MSYIRLRDVKCATFAITSRCNLRCVHCFRASLPQRGRDMDLEVFKRGLEQTSPSQEVDFVGLGEPLLHPSFLEMLSILKEKRVPVNFATNGTMLNEEYAREFVKLPVLKISISLDGSTKETYENFRRGANFDEVVENVKRLVEIKRSLGSQLPIVRLDMVGLKGNILELPKLVELASKIGADGVNLLNLMPLSREISQEHLHEVSRSVLINIYKDSLYLAWKHKIEIPPLRPLDPEPLECVSPWIDPFINIDGKVSSCCFVGALPYTATEWYKDTPVKYDPEKLQFGDIMEQSFGDIWNSQRVQDMRIALLILRDRDKKENWDIEKYRKLRLQNPEPDNICEVCSRRFQVAC